MSIKVLVEGTKRSVTSDNYQFTDPLSSIKNPSRMVKFIRFVSTQQISLRNELVIFPHSILLFGFLFNDFSVHASMRIIIHICSLNFVKFSMIWFAYSFCDLVQRYWSHWYGGVCMYTVYRNVCLKKVNAMLPSIRVRECTPVCFHISPRLFLLLISTVGH